MVLSLLVIPLVVMPWSEELSPQSRRAVDVLSVVVWAGFAVQYATMLALSPDPWLTIRTKKLDLALTLLPFLRPLRLTRLVGIARAGSAVARARMALRTLVGRPGFSTIIGAVGMLIAAGGGLVAIAEHDQPGSTIGGLGDGIWWAFVTCTTVGYGDEVPVTTTGRTVAVILMLAGISGLSVITANIAAFFVSADTEDEVDELQVQLDRIEGQLQTLTQQLEQRARVDE